MLHCTPGHACLIFDNPRPHRDDHVHPLSLHRQGFDVSPPTSAMVLSVQAFLSQVCAMGGSCVLLASSTFQSGVVKKAMVQSDL